VIEVVRRNVPFLVLDLPHVWSRWVQRTLVASDEVIIVCQPDLASLRNGKNYIDQLKAARPNDNPPRLDHQHVRCAEAPGNSGEGFRRCDWGRAGSHSAVRAGTVRHGGKQRPDDF
jgi:hypothetical protein